MKFFLTLFTFLFCISALIAGETPYSFERPAGGMSDCDTGDAFRGYTRITFYGDSRLDYADAYGYNMLYYINDGVDGAPGRSAPNFGIQNFGQAAWISWHLNDHLSNCLPNANYKVSNRFVVNIGGNDWIVSASYIIANPWNAVGTALWVENNVRSILGNLKAKASRKNGKFEVLILGNYQGVSGGYEYGETSTLEGIINTMTVTNAGLMYSNGVYQGIAEQFQIHFFDTAGVMRDLINPNSANPQLMIEPIHPNHAGLTVWGKAVGDYLGANGFKDSNIRPPLDPNLTRLQLAIQELQLARADLIEKERILLESKAELEERLRRLKELQDQLRDVEYKISLVTQRIDQVNARIAEIQSRMAVTDEEIVAKVEELRIADAERAKLEAERIAYEQEQVRIAAAVEAARVAAQIAQQAADLAQRERDVAAERVRLAEIAAAEAARLAAEEARNLALLLCWFFLKCW